MLQTTLGHLVKQRYDSRQLIKVEAVTQSYLWPLSASTGDGPRKTYIVTRGRQLTEVVLCAFSLSTVDLLLFPLLDLGMYTQFQRLSSPDSGNDTYRISRAPLLLCYHGVSCDVRNTWQSCLTRFKTAELVGETGLPPPPCLGLITILFCRSKRK